jgi:hypothetical protein
MDEVCHRLQAPEPTGAAREESQMFYFHLPRTNHDKSNQTDPVISLHVFSAC